MRKHKEESGTKKPEVVDLKIVDEEWCREHDLGLLRGMLEVQGWMKAFMEEEEVNPDMVRKLYQKLKIVKV